MKCPLRNIKYKNVYDEEEYDVYDVLVCLQDECAQWDVVSKQCYVLSDLELKRKILKELGKIATGVSVK